MRRGGLRSTCSTDTTPNERPPQGKRGGRSTWQGAGSPDPSRCQWSIVPTGTWEVSSPSASAQLGDGESVKDRLGHASATETLDTYSHLWPDSEDLTRTAVDKVLGVAAADSLRTGESN